MVLQDSLEIPGNDVRAHTEDVSPLTDHGRIGLPGNNRSLCLIEAGVKLRGGKGHLVLSAIQGKPSNVLRSVKLVYV